MKKFESLGRSLSKAEQKLILGGGDVLAFDDGSGGSIPCTQNSDCPQNVTVSCNGQIIPANSWCNSRTHTCYKSGVC